MESRQGRRLVGSLSLISGILYLVSSILCLKCHFLVNWCLMFIKYFSQTKTGPGKVPRGSCDAVFIMYTLWLWHCRLIFLQTRGFHRLSHWPQNRSIIQFQTQGTVLKHVVLNHHSKKLLNELLFKTLLFSNVVFSKTNIYDQILLSQPIY